MVEPHTKVKFKCTLKHAEINSHFLVESDFNVIPKFP